MALRELRSARAANRERRQGRRPSRFVRRHGARALLALKATLCRSCAMRFRTTVSRRPPFIPPTLPPSRTALPSASSVPSPPCRTSSNKSGPRNPTTAAFHRQLSGSVFTVFTAAAGHAQPNAPGRPSSTSMRTPPSLPPPLYDDATCVPPTAGSQWCRCTRPRKSSKARRRSSRAQSWTRSRTATCDLLPPDRIDRARNAAIVDAQHAMRVAIALAPQLPPASESYVQQKLLNAFA